jgi:hypothetical protein
VSNYHARIMNIPVDLDDWKYKVGHRDARHAAAMIALEAQAEVERVRARGAELGRLVRYLLENDPNDSAADGVTVLDVWRKAARAALPTEGGDDA